MKLKVLVIGLLALVLCIPVGAKTLEVWLTGHSNEEMRIMDDVIQRGWVAKTGIDVDLTVLSWGDFEQRYLMAAASGEGPDVGGMGGLFAPELGLRGAVVDLRATFKDYEEVAARFFPQFFRTVEYKSASFGIGYAMSTYVGYARTDIYEELGLQVPNTWDELKRDLPRMQARNTNFALTWGLTETVYADVNMFMWQNGADDFTPDLNQSGYDAPQAIEAFTNFAELYTRYGILREVPHFQAFTSGDLALTIHGLSFYTSLREAAPQLRGRYQMVLAPGTMYQGQLNRATISGPGILTIFQNSRMKQEAWEFIKWFSSTEVQVELSNAIMTQIPGAVFIPATKDGIMQLNWPERDRALLLEQISQGVSSQYGLVAPRHRRRYLQFAAQEAITLNVNPETAMRKAAAEHNAEIRRKQQEYARFIARLN